MSANAGVGMRSLHHRGQRREEGARTARGEVGAKQAPRSVHDYKPLMVLLQAVLASLLRKELAFFSSRIAELEKLLQQAMAELEQEKALNASLSEQLEIKEKNERRSNVLSKTSSLLSRARINSAAEERSRLESNLQGAVQEDAQRAQKEKEREKELAEMREYSHGKETQVADLSKKLSDTDRKTLDKPRHAELQGGCGTSSNFLKPPQTSSMFDNSWHPDTPGNKEKGPSDAESDLVSFGIKQDVDVKPEPEALRLTEEAMAVVVRRSGG
ncbi:hypothetical protein CYMTET_7058 [Cymbomonas tetramitiformis]|uniref:Uncharacterized protein n=1 Tax=Cymbomonas tetramitiformis TaxID=36881 RepID=A0AAE0GVR2_9CHLO|nr:hypothetical protein CYMTET_7058 [Cymbomonas tetramitiformis]